MTTGYGFMPVFDDEPEAQNIEVTFCRECDHEDCKGARKMRASICPKCGKGFKALDKYYQTEDGYVHFLCAH
jgi:hypothetical protein